MDFSGSAPQVRGSVNANYAITLSATFYAMKCLAAEAAPPNEGLLRPIKLIAPEASIVNARPARRGGGRQCRDLAADRRCALSGAAKAAPARIPAASSGSMSNLTVGGYILSQPALLLLRNDRRRRRRVAAECRRVGNSHPYDQHPQYARSRRCEAYYPLRITEYRTRRGSGGRGRFNGGDGLVRELECLTESNGAC